MPKPRPRPRTIQPRPRRRHWRSTFSHSFHRRLLDLDQHKSVYQDLDQDLDLDPDPYQHKQQDEDPDQALDPEIGFACFRTCLFHSSTSYSKSRLVADQTKSTFSSYHAIHNFVNQISPEEYSTSG